MRIPAWSLAILAVVVGAAILLGIRTSGSPLEARASRIDASRVAALRQLSAMVDGYYLRERRLPPDLSALGQQATRLATDPATGEPLEYRATGEKHYELCAVFSRPAPVSHGVDYWWHDAGRHCYGRVVSETR